MTATDRLLPLLARAGVFYGARFMDPLLRRYSNVRGSRRQSLSLFLRGYAFEHAGRNPHWAPCAAGLVEALETDSDLDSPDTGRIIWNEFTKYFDNNNLNPKVNPLAPQGTPFSYGQFTSQVSAIELSRSIHKPLVSWARESLIRGFIDQAHAEITTVNDVGKKIASFFLRDIAMQYEIEPEFNRFLCFPIDRWVRRASYSLWPELSGIDDLSVANEVVGHCIAARVSPEMVNAGMWYLGARISSEVDASELVERPEGWENAIQAYAARIRAMADAWNAYEPMSGYAHAVPNTYGASATQPPSSPG